MTVSEQEYIYEIIAKRRKILKHEVIKLEGIKLTSVNQKYITGGFTLSKSYRELKELLSLTCKKIELKPPYRVEIYLETYLDIDNCLKNILDSLGNCIVNDREILELLVHKKKTKRGKPGSVRVLVEELDLL